MSNAPAEKTLAFLRDEFRRFGSIFPNFNVAIYFPNDTLSYETWQAFVGQQILLNRATEWQEWQLMWDGDAAVRFYGNEAAFSTFENLAHSADLALERLTEPRHHVGQGMERWLAQLHFTGLCYPTPLLWLDARDEFYIDPTTETLRKLDHYELPFNAFTASAGLLEVVLNPDGAILIDDCLDKDALPVVATPRLERPPTHVPSVSSAFALFSIGRDVWQITFTSEDGKTEVSSPIHDTTGLRLCWEVMKAQGKPVSLIDLLVPPDKREAVRLSLNSADERTDRTGRAKLRRARPRLVEDLELAEEKGNDERAAELREALYQYDILLKKDKGLRGKSRSVGKTAIQKLNNRMHMFKKRAIDKCKDEGLPLFADHLKRWLVIDSDACRYCSPITPSWVFEAIASSAG